MSRLQGFAGPFVAEDNKALIVACTQVDLSNDAVRGERNLCAPERSEHEDCQVGAKRGGKVDRQRGLFPPTQLCAKKCILPWRGFGE